MGRSIFSLSLDELKEIASGTIPEDIDLEGIDKRKDFEKLFRMRNSLGSIASYLVKEAGESTSTTGIYKPVIPLALREEKLALKKEELAIKRAKLDKETTVMNKVEEMAILLNGLNKRMGAIEATLKRLVALHLERVGKRDETS